MSAQDRTPTVGIGRDGWGGGAVPWHLGRWMLAGSGTNVGARMGSKESKIEAVGEVLGPMWGGGRWGPEYKFC